MSTFRASVQYDDWIGTAAADDDDEKTLTDLLQAKGLLDTDNEFLVGVEIWIGENHDGQVQQPFIHCLIAKCGASFNAVAAGLKGQADPIPLRNVDVELTLIEFVGLFKRFSVVLTRKGLDLTDREYKAE